MMRSSVWIVRGQSRTRPTHSSSDNPEKIVKRRLIPARHCTAAEDAGTIAGTAVPSPTPPQLDYAPKPPLHCRRRFRQTVLGLVLLLVAASGLMWGPRAWRQAKLLYWQERCMTYAAPVMRCVYDSRAEPQAAVFPR